MSAIESVPKSRSRKRGAAPTPVAEGVVPAKSRWAANRVLLLALAGAGLLWAAFPPLGLSVLAWIAPIPWLLLIADAKLEARHPYRVLWIAGLMHWLAVLQGVRLAHWATYFGWMALGAYLAFYLPAFIALTRVAVQRMKVPLWVAAPVVWTGLEFARGYMATGFSLALLGHTQVNWAPLIQISDLAGAYGVSFLVMFVAACLTSCLPRDLAAWREARQWRWRPLLAAGMAVFAVVAYGQWRLSQPAEDAARGPLKVALVQKWVDTIFEYDPERDVQNFNGYTELSRQAMAAHPDLDAIIWPESAFTAIHPLVTREAKIGPPPGIEWPENIGAYVDDAQAQFDVKTKAMAREFGGKPSLVVGVSVQHYGLHGPEQYNAAANISPAGEVVGRYDKMHAVMFGEYVPLAGYFPWIYRLTPLGGGLSTGKQAEAFTVGGMRLAPNVCFESTVPHLIRRQIVDLARRGEKPDVLVNHTNDGWFWGSSICDLHLACGTFRAVEHRTPLLIAANTGLSAWIDGNGQTRAIGPRFQDGIVYAEVRPDPRRSIYTQAGDWPAGACLAFCGLAACFPVVQRWRNRPGPAV